MNEFMDVNEQNAGMDMDELLSMYLDEELDEKTLAYVQERLENDPEWQDALEELQTTVQAIRALPLEATPERELWPEIVAQREAGGFAGAQSRKRRRWPHTVPQLLAAALIGLAVPATAFTFLRSQPPAEPQRVSVSVPVRAPVAPSTRGLDASDIRRLQREYERAMREYERAYRDAARSRERSRGVQLQRGAMDAMFGLLNDSDPQVREQAVRALAEFESVQAVVPIGSALLNDPSAQVKVAAAWALGEMEHPAAIQALGRALLNDSDADVRRMAAWALGEIESPAGVDALGRSLVNDRDHEVQSMAAWALGEIESPAAVRALGTALNDRRNASDIRRMAAWALGEIESPQAVEALGAALVNDTDAEVQGMVAWALGEIESPQAVTYLGKALLESSNANVRQQSAWALGEI